MIADQKITKLLNDAEWLLEGLPKSFWRFIKLSAFEIWETPEQAEFEYAWVVAIMGNRCVFYNELNKGFVIGHYEVHGQLDERSLAKSAMQLNDLIENIISSRFSLNYCGLSDSNRI
jgi:hypothetical protein